MTMVPQQWDPRMAALRSEQEQEQQHHHHPQQQLPLKQPSARDVDLQHRLFPRAMAWHIHQKQQVQSNDPRTMRRDSTASDTWSYGSREEEYRRQHAPPPPPQWMEANEWHKYAACSGPPSETGSTLSSQSANEEIFKTMGKWLNRANGLQGPGQRTAPTAPMNARHPAAAPGYPNHVRLQATMAQETHYWQAPPPAAQVPNGYLHGQQEYPHPHSQHYHTGQSPFTNGHSLRPPATPHEQFMHHRPSIPVPSTEAPGKKRQRPVSAPSPLESQSSGDSLATPNSSTKTNGKKPGCGAKRCSVEGCEKIAVSKHLCRGHGGGRRCEYPGCKKCAQSRSPFCWAHGGGKRCEAPGCRRSRKTKRFCVEHREMEHTTPIAGETPRSESPVPSENDVEMEEVSTSKGHAFPHAAAVASGPNCPIQRQLPSLEEALKRVLSTTSIPAARGFPSVHSSFPSTHDPRQRFH